jgi:hypothetical protein
LTGRPRRIGIYFANLGLGDDEDEAGSEEEVICISNKEEYEWWLALQEKRKVSVESDRGGHRRISLDEEYILWQERPGGTVGRVKNEISQAKLMKWLARMMVGGGGRA